MAYIAKRNLSTKAGIIKRGDDVPLSYPRLKEGLGRDWIEQTPSKKKGSSKEKETRKSTDLGIIGIEIEVIAELVHNGFNHVEDIQNLRKDKKVKTTDALTKALMKATALTYQDALKVIESLEKWEVPTNDPVIKDSKGKKSEKSRKSNPEKKSETLSGKEPAAKTKKESGKKKKDDSNTKDLSAEVPIDPLEQKIRSLDFLDKEQSANLAEAGISIVGDLEGYKISDLIVIDNIGASVAAKLLHLLEE